VILGRNLSELDGVFLNIKGSGDGCMKREKMDIFVFSVIRKITTYQ